MTTTAAAPAREGALTHRQVLTILTGLLLGMFLGALDQTIVSTAIRRIGDDLHGLSVQAWVTTAFLITSTIATPLYGKLSDIYGRKPLFLIAISVFIVGSALCGLATSMYMLAAFRAFQGIGAGGLFSMALAIMADIVSPQQRPRYMGYFMATFATSSVLGPLIGGFLSGQDSILGVTGWRWIFYVNVPIGLIALVVVNRRLQLPTHARTDHGIDWQGATALVIGLVPLLIIAEQGREWGWASGGAFACYLIGAAGLAAFVWIEGRMGSDALIPLRLFRSGPFTVGAAQSFVIGIGMFGGIASIPLYLQIVKNASPTKAGLLTLPLVLGIMVASMSAGQFTSRTGRYKIFPIAGSALFVVSMFLLFTVGADTPLWQTDIYMLLFGAGLGLNMQTIQLAMQNAVPPRDIGVATSSGTFFRQVGGTLGTAVFLSILFSAAPHKISAAYDKAQQTADFQAAAAAHPDQTKLLSGGTGSLNDTSFVQKLDPTLAHPFQVGFSQAMDLVFLTGAIVLIIAVALALFLKEVPLRKVSGIEAVRMEAEANVTGGSDPSGATHVPAEPEPKPAAP
ncbi:MAG TPA: MDR family MFS transporter [Jatrophihabitantaceae bacterium]|jgi:EmrB/QacA subfamily drug resistance transporter